MVTTKENLFEIRDSRTDFTNSWLTEMPEKLNAVNAYGQLIYAIHDRIEDGIYPVVKVSNNLYKLEASQIVYYWYGKFPKMTLGVQLEKRPQALVSVLVGKKASLKGQPPFASDLYNEVLKDQKSPIRLMSDKQLSDEGFSIWKKLFSDGHKIGVYDRENPGQTFKKIDSQSEMDHFIGKDKSYNRYQYVIFESTEIDSLFEMRRFWEINDHLNGR